MNTEQIMVTRRRRYEFDELVAEMPEGLPPRVEGWDEPVTLTRPHLSARGHVSQQTHRASIAKLALANEQNLP